KLGETRKIEVEVRIQRSKTRYVMAWKTDDRNGQIEIPYNTYVPEKTNPIGEITLRSVFPRRDTAWAQRDEHMSRNFLHISFEENSEFNDTLVLLNSSSALTELARSMERSREKELATTQAKRFEHPAAAANRVTKLGY
ncbi:MAG: hypothetical protein AAF585_21980, partial [Verrucomicrobiota bacterium]